MAKTIYTYLHNDDLSGSRIVHMDNCFCKLYNIQRDDTDFQKEFADELQRPALYILLNKKDNKAYIGETDSFLKRLNQHKAAKSFWSEALAFTASDNTLTKTEVQYLEYLAYKQAAEMGTFDLSENTQIPTEPYMTKIQQNRTREFFKYVQFLTKFVGCDVFEKRKKVILKTSLESSKAIVLPSAVSVKPEDIAGSTKLMLNGDGPFNKRRFAYHVVKSFVKQNPDATFEELRATFKREYLQRFSQFEFLQEDIEGARKWEANGFDHNSYFTADSDILISGDGIPFIVCVEWDKNNLINLLGIAKTMGWSFDIVKN